MKLTHLYYLCEHVFLLKGYSVRGTLHRQRKKVKRRSRCHRRQCSIPLREPNKCSFFFFTHHPHQPHWHTYTSHRKHSWTLLHYIASCCLNLKKQMWNSPPLRWPPTSLPGSGDISDSSLLFLLASGQVGCWSEGGWWFTKARLGT